MGADGSDMTAASSSSGLQLTLELEHPDCWMREVTAATAARLLVNAAYLVDGKVKAHVVAYAESAATVEALVAATRASDHTHAVTEMDTRRSFGGISAPVNKATRTLLVEYGPEESIHDALVSHGFMNQEPIRIRDGTEYWTVAIDESRATIQEKLDAVCAEKDATITVTQITSATTGSRESDGLAVRQLSDKQREVFELARNRGYYDYPREVSGSELADELGVAKTTFHEHLRKVEATLLGPSGADRD
ncbi:helix-turn-helix domain-containing protein [Haloarcula sp. NS06]|uniref:helix-turn-helix domain-containing protein n=1 Tax=unclassified Haloarcula TaxID=2624677 RepID=UPI0027AF17D7|nr:helix-turn-helix domain-containing protein [Haloarcula sp. H-GB4]MDQ2071630.1 helix-turn-helix domain-containing protein [Haloarcula sp. H-GB4]